MDLTVRFETGDDLRRIRKRVGQVETAWLS